jgi:hypothetical protein
VLKSRDPWFPKLVSGPVLPESCDLGANRRARLLVVGHGRRRGNGSLCFRDPCFPSESGPLLPEMPRCAFVHALLIVQLDIITKYK